LLVKNFQGFFIKGAQKGAPFLASLNLHVHTKNKYSLQTQIDS
jgi:hypothetical protein